MGSLSLIARAWLRRVVVHEVRVLIAAPVSSVPPTEESDSECVIIESVRELEALRHEIPTAFYPKLRRAVERSFIVGVRQSAVGAPGKQIIAYRICERGVFVAPGLRKPISPDFMFVHYAEVLPQYRGKRVATKLKAYLHRYAQARNIRWVCGAVTITNSASMAAHLRTDEGFTPQVIA